MSRPTDTERGARIALDYVELKLIIKQVASDHLVECKALREARA